MTGGTDPDASPEALARIADAACLRRIHMVAWRDRDDPTAGGSEEHASQIAAHWAAAGLDVTLRTAAVPGGPDEVVRDGYRVIRRGGRFTVFARTALAGLLDLDGRPDAVVEIFHGLPFFGPLWTRAPRIAVLHHLHLDMWHSLLPPAASHIAYGVERYVQPALYRKTRIVAVSDSTRQALVDDLGLDNDRITVVPNGVDARFSPGGTKAPAPTIMAAGRFMPPKRFDLLIDVVAEVHRHVPDLRVWIAGEGPLRSELEAQARRVGGAGWIEFLGRVSDDDLVDRYRSAWLVASTSIREGWGLTLTEGAACGTPGVATRIPGHVDAVVDGTTGLLATGTEELAGAMVRVLTDDDLRTRLTEGALARAPRLTWPQSALGTLRVVADEAARHPDRLPQRWEGS
ncbi:MAG: glycosyltransferase family 4 protein [Acidimicrobiia bacterium]